MSRSVTIHQSFQVGFDYPVVFSAGVFDAGVEVLAETLDRLGEKRRHRAAVFVDSGVAEHQPELMARIEEWFAARGEQFELVTLPRVVPGGEAMKNDYRLLMEVVDTLLEYRMCRHSFVIAIGGGAVLDAIGFGAAIVHRGLRMVRMPSTTLAQNDAGIGVKNAMNLHGGKNTIGVFHPPFAVINDASLLATQSFEDWIAGASEAYKVALIKDQAFLDALVELAPKLRERDEPAMAILIRRCAELHLEHIRTSGDPFELGRARPLDFGHWAAHKLESMTAYALGHGSAVAIGIAIDLLYAAHKGWVSNEECERVLNAMHESGLPLWHDVIDRRLGDGTREVLAGLEDFREHLGGELCVTFPNGLGRSQEVHEVELVLVDEMCDLLRARFAKSTMTL